MSEDAMVQMIHEILGIKSDRLRGKEHKSLFGREIRMDGLEAAYLFSELERRLVIDISEENLKRYPFTSVKNIVDLVNCSMAEKGKSE